MSISKSNYLAVVGDADNNIITTIPMITGEGRRSNPDLAVNKDGFIFVSGHDAFCPDVVVKTTPKELEEAMKISKDEAKIVFLNVWRVIKHVNVDELYQRGGVAWSNFMNDIIIYYGCRWVLFNKPAPVIFGFKE